MSGTVDFSRIVSEQVNGNKILSGIQQQLAKGILSSPSLASYPVASLPAGSGPALAWAANGRKPGEGTGAGTGVPVFWNPSTSQWYSFLSGAQVTA